MNEERIKAAAENLATMLNQAKVPFILVAIYSDTVSCSWRGSQIDVAGMAECVKEDNIKWRMANEKEKDHV